jgi:hypothetical protein
MLTNILDLKDLTFTGASAKYRGNTIPRIARHSRIVFLFGPFVIKHGGLSSWQTHEEIDFYDRLRYSDREYFPKLIDFDRDRNIIVQEYIPLVMDDDRITQRVRRTVERLIGSYNLSDMHSDCMFNWGLNAYTGKPVIFDLGISS